MFGFWDSLEELPEDEGFFPDIGDLDVTMPSLTMIGGIPYDEGGYSTHIIRRQGDQVLTPDGWFDLDEFEDFYE